MHEFPTISLLQELIQEQLPFLSDLPLQQFASTPRVVLYRLGNDLLVKLPQSNSAEK